MKTNGISMIVKGFSLCLALLALTIVLPAASYSAELTLSDSSDSYDPPPELTYGTRVRALVDNPSGSDCVKAGNKGTVYCYDYLDPIYTYLVDWDNGCGAEQDQICGITADNGWWVGPDDIEVIVCDLNGDGKINTQDLIIRAKELSAWYQQCYQTQDLSCGDLDLDGQVNIRDLKMAIEDFQQYYQDCI